MVIELTVCNYLSQAFIGRLSDIYGGFAPLLTTAAHNVGHKNLIISSKKKELLYLYRRLLRGCETFPSKNKWKIYQSIQEEFRLNATLDPTSSKVQQQISVAIKGLQQLHQFDDRLNNTSFSISLEQNPFPKPSSSEDDKTTTK